MFEGIEGIIRILDWGFFDVLGPGIVVLVVGDRDSGLDVFPVLGFFVSSFLEPGVFHWDLLVFYEYRFFLISSFVPHGSFLISL